ncbi:hypothetical protein GCM10022243_34950 [Saccharothrix violaceirubra]|uniref:Uncharacterized protein n=1 Tax=Saccharothrix violaceirubra TaxID=413306 RepID=A0A7W7T4T8_9PSEU|nr:bacteriophage spanin2 family protein [Saccharothrix violaceirubra]MBB4966547.1 hypothetical protein [Saccharothrix violaceirubra]
MRATIVVIAAFAAITTLGACGSIAETASSVANTATTVQVCADALSQVSIPLDVSSPQRAVDQAHQAATELSALAAKAADTTINEAIAALARTMTSVTVDDLVGRPAQWLADQAGQVATLTGACS